MTPSTQAAIERLEEADWFSKCGQHDLQSDTFEYAQSWDDALAHGTSDLWFNVRLEGLNRFRERLFSINKDLTNRWNDVIAAVNEVVDPLVESKTAAVVATHSLSEQFVDEVKGDIRKLLATLEYSDIVPPGMAYGLSYYYEQGHWPCGWNGPAPTPDGPLEGKLIIF